MRNLLEEDLLPFAAAIRSLPGRPHLSSGYRFISQRGCRGVRLESIVVGGRRFTSRQALRRFVEATTAAADRSQPLTAAATQQDAKQVESDLDAAGL
jgi:hypothetical protein